MSLFDRLPSYQLMSLGNSMLDVHLFPVRASLLRQLPSRTHLLIKQFIAVLFTLLVLSFAVGYGGGSSNNSAMLRVL